MINNLQSVLGVLLLVGIFNACREEIPIDMPDSQRKIVVNALFENDSYFSAQVYKSGLVTDQFQTPLYMDNAKVEVFANQVLVEELPLVFNGYYRSASNKAHSGIKYSLQVSIPNMKTATSSVEVLQPVPILSFDSIGMVSNEWGGKSVKMEVKFQDDATQRNYYRLSIMVSQYNYYYDSLYQQVLDSVIYLSWTQATSNDPVVESGDVGQFYFSDALIQGKMYNFEVLVEDYSYNQYSKYYYAILEHISYDFYRYSVSLPAHYDAEDNKFFMESVLVYNNIENGLGILGSTVAYTDSIYNSNFGKINW